MGTVRRYLFATLLLAVGASPLWAGSNAGFKINLNPREIRDPVVGQRVSAALGVEQIVAGKQSQIQIAYDPRHIGNVQIAPGPFIPVRLPLPAAPDTLSRPCNNRLWTVRLYDGVWSGRPVYDQLRDHRSHSRRRDNAVHHQGARWCRCKRF